MLATTATILSSFHTDLCMLRDLRSKKVYTWSDEVAAQYALQMTLVLGIHVAYYWIFGQLYVIGNFAASEI